MYFLYMIKNTQNKLYIGVTKNIQQRLSEHNSKRGALFTSYTPNYKLVFLEEYENLALARRREIQLKKWSREKKEFLITRFSSGLETRM